MSLDLMPGFGAFTQSSAPAWTPANLVYPGVWYDAKDAATITEEGGNAVLQWNDKSGNSRHLTCGSGNSLRWNDVDAIDSPSGSHALVSGSFAANAIVRDNVKGIVAAILTYTSGIVWAKYSNVDDATNGRVGFEGTNRADWPNDSTAKLESWSSTLSSSTFKVVSVRHSGTTLTARLNGTQVGTLSTSTQFANPSSTGNLGLFGTAGGAYSTATIKTFLWCGDNDLTTEQKIEGYLAWRFGLQGDLDAGHPYKSAAPVL